MSYLSNYFKCRYDNSPIKGQGLGKWIQKDLPICWLHDALGRSKDKNRFKVKEMKNILHAQSKQKRDGMAIVISDKCNLDKKLLWDKEGHWILIKG